MIPRTEVDVSASVPDRAAFWVPEEDDISDEGFGVFRGTWPIIGVNFVEATQVMEGERLALNYVDANSATAEEFESLAKELEDYGPEDSNEDPPQFVLINPDWYGLEWLELGVAGLVFALSARGLYPAASGRSHHHERTSWADYPVVYFAGDRDQIQHLQPLAEASGGTTASRPRSGSRAV